jgi:hypothetical protein
LNFWITFPLKKKMSNFKTSVKWETVGEFGAGEQSPGSSKEDGLKWVGRVRKKQRSGETGCQPELR